MKLPIPFRGLFRGLAICAALAAASASAGPRDPLYQWTDAKGAVRYTSEIERIPAEQRASAAQIAGRTDTGPSGAPSAAQPAAPPPAAPPVGSAPPPAVTAAPTNPQLIALDARIAALEQQIAADESALGDYISDPERASKRGGGDVAAIADRLPKLQNQLRELRAQRAAAAGTAAGANAVP